MPKKMKSKAKARVIHRISRSKSKSKAKKPSFKVVRNVGRRCVEILASGKWKFRKNAACKK